MRSRDNVIVFGPLRKPRKEGGRREGGKHDRIIINFHVGKIIIDFAPFWESRGTNGRVCQMRRYVPTFPVVLLPRKWFGIALRRRRHRRLITTFMRDADV